MPGRTWPDSDLNGFAAFSRDGLDEIANVAGKYPKPNRCATVYLVRSIAQGKGGSAFPYGIYSDPVQGAIFISADGLGFQDTLVHELAHLYLPPFDEWQQSTGDQFDHVDDPNNLMYDTSGARGPSLTLAQCSNIRQGIVRQFGRT